MRRPIKTILAALLTTMATSALADDLPVRLPPNLDALRMPPVEDPSAFIERTLTQYRADLATFEAMLEDLGEEEVQPPDADTLLQAAEKKQPAPKILTASIIDDRLLRPPPPLDLPPGAVFIDRIRIAAGSQGEKFAADARTAVALNLRNIVGIQATGDATFVFSNRKRRGCCAIARRHEDGSVVNQFGQINCVRYHEVPTLERRKNIDLRALIGHKITFQWGGELRDGGIGGLRPSDAAGVQTLIAKVQQGRVPRTEVACKPFGGKETIAFNPGPAADRSIKLNVVKLGEIGVAGIDPVATTNGRFAPKHYFGGSARGGSGGRLEFGPGAGRGALSRIGDVIGELVEQDGDKSFRRVSATLREIGAGPFAVTRNRISLPNNFRPGTSTIRWRLPGDAEIIEHDLTASRIDVEIDERIREQPPKDGVTYTAKIVIDGPADLAGMTLDWGGTVNWLDTPSFVAEGKKQVATNRFFAPPLEDRFPSIEIAMNGPEGEVFNFKRGVPASVEALEGLTVLAGKGSLGQPTEPKTALDFFFPTADPTTAMHARIAPTLETGRGPLEILTQDPEAEIVKAHQARADRLVVVDNLNLLQGDPVARPGFIELVMAPVVAAAKAAVQVGGPAFDPENRLGLPGGRPIVSAPIDLTVNSVRLIRRGGGFDLMVRGAADMTKYQARWTRKGFSGSSTGFEAADDGFVARFDTKERLSKVEIVEGDAVQATILGLQATVPAQIRLLPFDSPINQIEKAALRDFSDLESVDECIGTVQFGIEFMEFDTGGRSARDFCQAERKDEKAKIREDRDAGGQRNRLIREFERQGKELISLSDAMNVAAIIKGLPTGEVGDLACVWTISRAGPGMRTGSRVSSVERTGPAEGVCVNRVLGIREGFAPGAKLKVTLILDDRPNFQQVTQQANAPAFGQQDGGQ